jgi:crossover junction endodeoxyribonuclease RuvC
MPCLKGGPAGRREVNAPLLAQIVFASHADYAFVESVNARPVEGPTGAFAFGRARGVVIGAARVGVANIPDEEFPKARLRALARRPNKRGAWAAMARGMR